MSRLITPTDRESFERLSGRLFYKKSGDGFYYDMGDVSMFKQSTTADTVEAVIHTRAATERRIRLDQRNSSIGWEVELQQHTLLNEALLMNGLIGASADQAAITVAATKAITITAKDVWYEIGKLDLHTVSATVSAAAKKMGVIVDTEIVPSDADVVVDAQLGLVMFPSTGSLAKDDVVTVSYKANAASVATIEESGQHAVHYGSFKLTGFDGGNYAVRKIYTFDGQLTIKDRGDNKTDGFNKFTVEVLAIGDITVQLPG